MELFNLNEPINGEASESDYLFRESKLTPATNNFPLSKIEEMRKLASTLSKKISAISSVTKSTHDENKETRNDAHERKHNEQNNNLRCNEASVTENHSSENQTLCSPQINTQEPSENVNSITDSDIGGRNDNAEDNGASKDGFELDVILTNTTNDILAEKEKSKSVLSDGNREDNGTSKSSFELNVALTNSTNHIPVEKEENKSVLSDDKVESSHTRKSKKSRKKERRNVSAMFEGERVSCLIGRRLGHSNEKEQSVLTTDDDYVLRKLFAKSSNYFNVVIKNSIVREDGLILFKSILYILLY